MSSARPESPKNKNLEFNPRLSPIFPKEFELNKNCSSFKNYTDYENIVNTISSENLASIPDYYREDVFQSADLGNSRKFTVIRSELATGWDFFGIPNPESSFFILG